VNIAVSLIIDDHWSWEE